MLGSLHRFRRVLELGCAVWGVACAQVQGHGLALPGELFSWYRKVTAELACGMSWASCVASQNCCPLSAVSQPAAEWQGSEWGGSGSWLDLASASPFRRLRGRRGDSAPYTDTIVSPNARRDWEAAGAVERLCHGSSSVVWWAHDLSVVSFTRGSASRLFLMNYNVVGKVGVDKKQTLLPVFYWEWSY